MLGPLCPLGFLQPGDKYFTNVKTRNGGQNF